MNENYYQSFTLPILWEQIRDIRINMRELLSSYSDHLQNGAAVAASELMENAIKYGMSTPDMPEALVEVQIADNILSIRVSNGLRNPTALERLKSHIDRLQSDDPVQLFVEQLNNLGQTQNESTGLGIYRAAAEGGFSLQLLHKDSVVTVIAKRSLSDGD